MARFWDCWVCGVALLEYIADGEVEEWLLPLVTVGSLGKVAAMGGLRGPTVAVASGALCFQAAGSGLLSTSSSSGLQKPSVPETRKVDTWGWKDCTLLGVPDVLRHLWMKKMCSR